MKRGIGLVVLPLLAGIFLFPEGCGKTEASSPAAEVIITLPEPAYDGDTSVEEALLGRRSVREYGAKAVTLQQLGQLLWAAQGITGTGGKRTAPSAGGLYPLEVYVVAGNVEGIEQGIYRYRPATHDLAKMVDGDMREALVEAALDQIYVKQAALDIVITAVYARTTGKYGDRGKTYVHMEAGHAAENICLEAVALKLGTVTIGAFEDDRVKKVLTCPEDEVPLYVLPVGNPID
jgi:SagB-type dehydrogenase family enzyme